MAPTERIGVPFHRAKTGVTQDPIDFRPSFLPFSVTPRLRGEKSLCDDTSQISQQLLISAPVQLTAPRDRPYAVVRSDAIASGIPSEGTSRPADPASPP